MAAKDVFVIIFMLPESWFIEAFSLVSNVERTVVDRAGSSYRTPSPGGFCGFHDESFDD
jgi:hypothetical protein